MQKLLEKISPDVKPIAKNIIDELKFMQKVLKDLKEAIQKNGAANETATIKSYNQTVKNFGSLLKQLEMILRKDGVKIEGENALQQWLDKK